MKFLNSFTFLMIAISVVLFSCSNETEEVIQDQGLLVESFDIPDTDLKLEMYGHHKLMSGYNPLGLRVVNANGETVDAQINVEPMMYMGGGTYHYTPIDVPAIDFPKGQTPIGILFVMSSTNGYWELTFSVEGNGVETQFSERVQVADSQPEDRTYGQHFLGTLIHGEPYYFSYYWKNGRPLADANEWVGVAYKFSRSNGFVPVSGLEWNTISWMASMNHGAPENQTAEEIDGFEGHYATKVNFTMTGDWQIANDVKMGEMSVLSSEAMPAEKEGEIDYYAGDVFYLEFN
ncbi:FixH family protein [Persicobacter psychrovividus]|uniref:YtkA-like domain-containing protein n=1 Tax=Persicobacter psychrovividus TaxID=387638 RepID=A0ABM7VDI3_9BACT|nr:hypothetical protein PEPS_12950 [Persicobacter psychrovividus]